MAIFLSKLGKPYLSGAINFIPLTKRSEKSIYCARQSAV